MKIIVLFFFGSIIPFFKAVMTYMVEQPKLNEKRMAEANAEADRTLALLKEKVLMRRKVGK